MERNDYIHSKQSGFDYWAVKLAAVNAVIFLAGFVFPDFLGQFVLVSSQVATHPWTLVTATFLHGDLIHLGSNMFALLLFGSILEQRIGSKGFLIIYFASGIAASIGAAIFYPASLGASGAIFGILGALAVLRPRLIVWVLGVPMYMIIAAFVWAALDLIGMFSPSNVANAAHLVGLGFGAMAGLELRARYRKTGEYQDSKGDKKNKDEDYIISEKELDEWERKYMKRI